jgi:hypothetical protein
MQKSMRAWIMLAAGVVATISVGCGPAAPKVVLERPTGFSTSWHGKPLFHTPNGYIYAKDEMAAGEADRFVTETAGYVKRKYGRDLEKGVVLLLESDDRSLASSLEELERIENDPALAPVRPRKRPTLAETRKKMADPGIPEGPIVASTSLGLPQTMLSELGVNASGAAWAVAAPSEARAKDCGVKIMAAAMRKKKPSLSQEDAERHAAMFAGMMSSEICKARGLSVFKLWVQRQSDWSDAQKREALRKRFPSSADVEW